MAYAPTMNSEFIVSYFGTLSRETSIDVMKEMLGKNMRQNLQMVVQVRKGTFDGSSPCCLDTIVNCVQGKGGSM